MAVHETLRLHITADNFIIEPTDSGSNELLVIDRVTREITTQDNQGQIPASSIAKPIFGIFGIIHLIAGPYLIVITKREKVGELNGHTIWAVTDTEIHSYSKTLFHLTEKQITFNKTYLSMVEHVVALKGYYFSATYDLTHSMQRLHNTSPEFLSIPLHERADARFMWNYHVMRDLSEQPELSQYCLPIVHGFISAKTSNIGNKTFTYLLISRRSVYRAGTRFYMRGLDTEGKVANYVETEQILLCDGHKCSFVQTRGSIPLFWSQRPDLKYKPRPVIHNSSNHMEGFSQHFDEQIYNYGKQVLVNLVNGSGSEGLLAKAFAQSVINAQNSKVRYEFFDFHHECGQTKWHRLAILMNRLEEERQNFGYLAIQRDGTELCEQEGVFRTNCIDCLDRTNVVQSMFARITLAEQFRRFGILESNQKIEDFKQFNSLFMNVWADNADALSVQYAGTGALKTDYTRTGARTLTGMMMDGWNSLTRYFINNFRDGFRQDSVDLFLGNYVIEEEEDTNIPSPYSDEWDWKFYVIPVIFVITVAMCILSILIPHEHFGEQLMYVIFWGGAATISFGLIYLYGVEYVNSPRLAQAKVKME
ncbi:hypothetical protein ScPMuIL_000685 [Solemya velum]